MRTLVLLGSGVSRSEGMPPLDWPAARLSHLRFSGRRAEGVHVDPDRGLHAFVGLSEDRLPRVVSRVRGHGDRSSADSGCGDGRCIHVLVV